MEWWNALDDADRNFWMLASMGTTPAHAWAYFKRCDARGIVSHAPGDRRAAARQANPARHVADAHADARRLREVVEGLAELAMNGQLPAASDMQKVLALARITEFHTARAERSLSADAQLATAQESAPCL